MTIRLATWNLWWRFGDFEARQPAIDQTLQNLDADVIGVQESWPGQVERIAELLGYHWTWSGNRPKDKPDSGMGNGILSRWPIAFEDHVFLDDGKGRKYRTILGASIETPAGRLPFFATHLNFSYDESAVRMAQLHEASEFVESLSAGELPPVIAADLNAVPDSDEVRKLTGRSAPYMPGRIWTDTWEQLGDGPGLTWTTESPYINNSAWPNRRLDYLMIGWPRENRPVGNPVSVELFGKEPIDGVIPSDHWGVTAEMHV